MLLQLLFVRLFQKLGGNDEGKENFICNFIFKGNGSNIGFYVLTIRDVQKSQQAFEQGWRMNR